MTDILKRYEVVIGLEVHAELNTASKVFCSCPTAFGAQPNRQCCPVCAGLPGAVPRLNREAVEKAITAGLALHCEIAEVSRMDRKQYFYPDLPKAYQISQNEFPLCKNGYLDIETVQGEKRIGITRIHLEEDAGKLIHTEQGTRLDCNRSGVGLIEIVSEPDLRSAEEAVAYLKELRGILLACKVSDCKMQEGSFRCDVNLSLRPIGSERMGERTEIKNLNSFSFTEKAIGAEIRRQAEELEREGRVQRRTVRFLPADCRTEPMRMKESAADYRFFPDSNLPPIRIDLNILNRRRREIPELPAEKRKRLISQYGITREDACVLTENRGLSDYYEATAVQSHCPVQVCNLLLNDLIRLCDTEPFVSPVSAQRLGELADLLGEELITRGTARKLLTRLTATDFSPREIAVSEGLTQINDEAVLWNWVLETAAEDFGSVTDYRKGKSNAKKALQGRLMAKSRGRANPVLAEKLLLKKLNEEN